MRLREVLAITRRPAELCANRPLLDAAGFQLVTAANVAAARELIQHAPPRGLIVCLHSWSGVERDAITSGLKSYRLPLMKCPGCLGCDEVAGRAGTLDVLIPLTDFIERMDRAVA